MSCKSAQVTLVIELFTQQKDSARCTINLIRVPVVYVRHLTGLCAKQSLWTLDRNLYAALSMVCDEILNIVQITEVSGKMATGSCTSGR